MRESEYQPLHLSGRGRRDFHQFHTSNLGNVPSVPTVFTHISFWSPAFHAYIHFLRNASRSALILSACVVGMPCGKSLYVISVPFFSNFAAFGPAATYGTIWSSSLCITSTGIVIFFKASVKSVCEKATIPS